MDKGKEIERLKQALDEVPHLRTLPYKNGEFAMWQDRVCRMLESAYGKESVEYRRFVNAPGITFMARTEVGQQQDYNWRLDCYEDVLKALIE